VSGAAASAVGHTQRLYLHATCVALAGKGVLLRGPPSAGKSDLALRLIDRGAHLVADDQVVLRRAGPTLRAEPPEPLAGLLEVRGLGIFRLPWLSTELRLIVDLAEAGAPLERLPEPRELELLGATFPAISLDPDTASAVARVRAALRWRRAV
jgi:serine kinase of HPr protein (carbohydrate metabolism regulator)